MYQTLKFRIVINFPSPQLSHNGPFLSLVEVVQYVPNRVPFIVSLLVNLLLCFLDQERLRLFRERDLRLLTLGAPLV